MPAEALLSRRPEPERHETVTLVRLADAYERDAATLKVVGDERKV
jgi:hypothetical protein